MRPIAYGLILTTALVLWMVNYTEAPVRYRLGTGDTIDFSAVTKTNQGSGSGLDADTVDGRDSSDFIISGTAGIKDADIDWGLASGQVNTDDLPEGTANKYFSGKTTDNLTEGTGNLYYTDARFDTRFGTKTTDDLPEGTVNKYNPYGASIDSAEITDGTITDADINETAGGSWTFSGSLGVNAVSPAATLHVRKGGGPGNTVNDANAVVQYDTDTAAANFWFNIPSGPTGTNATIGFATNGTIQHGLTYNVAGDYAVLTNDGANGSPTTGVFVGTGGNVGVGTSSFGTSASKVFGIANGTAPATSPANMVQLWAEDVNAVSELKARDEAGNVVVLTEPMAPAAHASTHVSGGADALSGDLDSNARIAVRKNTGGTDVGKRRRLNFIEGSNVTLTMADDAAGEEVDITIAASSGSSFVSRARVKRTTTQSLTSGVWTKAQLDTEEYDNNNEFDSTTNYRFTAGAAGGYLVTADAQVNPSAGGYERLMDIYRNGTSLGAIQTAPFSASIVSRFSTSTVAELAANDYIELFVYQDSGTALNLNNANMTVTRLW